MASEPLVVGRVKNSNTKNRCNSAFRSECYLSYPICWDCTFCCHHTNKFFTDYLKLLPCYKEQKMDKSICRWRVFRKVDGKIIFISMQLMINSKFWNKKQKKHQETVCYRKLNKNKIEKNLQSTQRPFWWKSPFTWHTLISWKQFKYCCFNEHLKPL